ncbi:MAG TPA: hypothetical protein VF134_03235 [Candidatus Dormibacteraeota bacterium]
MVGLEGGRRQAVGGAWMTYDGLPDRGTAGTTHPYSVSTAGVLLPGGRALYVDVFAGAEEIK